MNRLIDKVNHSAIFPSSLIISLTLLGISILLMLIFPSTHRRIAALAMLFSTLGDMALMDYRHIVSRWTSSVLIVGGILFIISHLLYSLAFYKLMKVNNLGINMAGVWAAIAVGAAAFFSLVILAKINGTFTWLKAVLLFVYAGISVLDCLFVFSSCFGLVAVSRVNIWRLLAPLGVISFIISDYFIGMSRVAGIDSMGKYIWWFYPIGQLLMIIAA